MNKTLGSARKRNSLAHTYICILFFIFDSVDTGLDKSYCNVVCTDFPIYIFYLLAEISQCFAVKNCNIACTDLPIYIFLPTGRDISQCFAVENCNVTCTDLSIYLFFFLRRAGNSIVLLPLVPSLYTFVIHCASNIVFLRKKK